MFDNSGGHFMNARSMVVALLSLGSMPLVSGCQQEEPKAPVEVIVLEPNGAAKLPPGVANGRSPNLRDAAPLSLWIGRSASGEYFLRTTTARTKHRFVGRFHAVEGELTNFRPKRMDHNDRFRFEGKDVVFDITTQAEEDGFDFGVSKSGCVEMDIRIDGKASADLIKIGEKEAQPPKSHFVICP
jgi:hypothetical protein